MEQRIIFKFKLPKDIYQLKTEFNKYGKLLYVVGGAVRDLYQNIIPHDIDLVTNASPEESKKILKNFNVSDEQGKSFGVLRVFTEDEPLGYELAALRCDISRGRDTKGNDQKVEIGAHITIYDDVQRRDLTMNALFYDISKEEIVDLVGGISDIDNNIISAVGKASDRFVEDRLRILRVFRFASRNLSTISDDTSDAIKSDHRLRNISSVDDVSQERIVEEFVKAVEWAEKNKKIESLTYYLELLKEYDMFAEMFPNLNVDIDNIKTFDLSIIFAMLFRNNDISVLKKKLHEYKVPSKYADPACFLLTLKRDLHDLNNILALHKDKLRYHITEKMMVEFVELYSFKCDMFQAFIKFETSVDAYVLMENGFKGAELGTEIKRLEIENFKKLLIKK